VSVRLETHLEPTAREEAMAADVVAGLTADQKRLPPIWFYDERGSILFDEITRLSEYYLTRAEQAILEAHADDIVAAAPAQTLVELGSGTSEKTRLLLDAYTRAGILERFVPLDVSPEVLEAAARDIAEQYGLEVTAVVGDFHRHLRRLPDEGRRLVAFLGSTIGNFDPPQRRHFLTDLDAALGHDEWLLLGTDLVKDVDRLVAAYDDAAGVTADFNRNVLRVLNQELGADFDPDAFEHRAVWNEEQSWIEMRLRARRDLVAHVPALDLTVSFAEGEELLTETCAKFRPDALAEELWDLGWVTDATWTDPAGDFQLSLLHPYC